MTKKRLQRTYRCDRVLGIWRGRSGVELHGIFLSFGAVTETCVGDRSAELSFSDALENLDFAFSAAIEANKGQWSFLADYMLTDLSFNNSTPSPAFGDLDASVENQTLTGYVS